MIGKLEMFQKKGGLDKKGVRKKWKGDCDPQKN